MAAPRGSVRFVDVIPTLQALHPQDVGGRVTVVVDVLRATSTIVTALSSGAAEVRPAATPEEARAKFKRLAAARGGSDTLLLGGERLGLRIEGFDLGNSPLEYTPQAVTGKTILLATTNGTKTLRRAAGRRPSRAAPQAAPASRVIVAAFLNARAVADVLAHSDESVVIACAGTRGGFSLEDVLLAGLLVGELQRRGRGELVFRDLARAAAALYRSLAGSDGENLARAVADSDHARYLTGLGFAADVAYCARLDVTTLVPEYRGGRVRAGGRTSWFELGGTPGKTGRPPSTCGPPRV